MGGSIETPTRTVVAVDPASLRAQAAGEGARRYEVTLGGDPDARWVEAYRRVIAESTAFRRFRLDPESCTISFSCRTIDGPADVMEVLERLEALVHLVNQHLMDHHE
jgi:hypothetical protein